MNVSKKSLTKKAAALVFAIAGLCFSPLFGQSDATLLNMLVENGTLTQQEAADIKKLSSQTPVCKPTDISSIRISAKFQTQYEFIDTDCDDSCAAGNKSPSNSFLIRRMILGFETDNGDNWGVRYSFDYIFANKTSNTYIWHKLENSIVKGEMRLGYLKPDFCIEETTSAFNLYAVERSIATTYWCNSRNQRRLGFGSFKTGAYWYGQSQYVDGLRYSCGVSNSENYKLSYDLVDGDNTPNLWLAASYTFDAFGGKIRFGGNFGWCADANKTALDGSESMWGANPYITFERGGTRAMAEFMASGVDGGNSIGGYRQQYPLGLNVAIEHKFDVDGFGKIAPVFRYTYLDTDGRGVSPSDTLRHCKATSIYTRASGYYFGVNWYLMGNNLKFQAGYEFSQFEGGTLASHSLDANSFRMQMQAMF